MHNAPVGLADSADDEVVARRHCSRALGAPPRVAAINELGVLDLKVGAVVLDGLSEEKKREHASDTMSE